MREKLAELEQQYDALNRQLCEPEVLSSPEKLKALSKTKSNLEEKVQLFRELKSLETELDEAMSMKGQDEDPEFTQYINGEIERLTQLRQNKELELQELMTPRDPYANRDIIVEIRAGTGGEEAALFAADLYRMYIKYAERKSWKAEVISSNFTELGGYKEVIFSLAGKNVYLHMKYESGIHRVQRVPSTEASGRIHTSAVTVAVMPEPEEVDIQINPSDLRVDTFRASGAGGQHVNKTDSAIRITHIPTGIVVSCQDERSQHQNRDRAMRLLRAKLLEIKMQQQEDELIQSRRMMVKSGDRSEKIRTYNFPQNRITDHRIGKTLHNLDGVLEGDLEDMVQTLIKEDQQMAISGGRI